MTMEDITDPATPDVRYSQATLVPDRLSTLVDIDPPTRHKKNETLAHSEDEDEPPAYSKHSAPTASTSHAQIPEGESEPFLRPGASASPSVTPLAYGATAPSRWPPRPINSSHRRRCCGGIRDSIAFKLWTWKMAVRDACCRWMPCLIIAALISSIIAIFIVSDVWYTCVIPEDAEVIHLNHTIDPKAFSSFHFHLDKGISGSISITQSRSRADKDIQIFVAMKASTPLMLDHISTDLQLDHRLAKAESRVFLDMTDKEIKRALARNCTHVEMDIIFPRGSLLIERLQVDSNFKGDVSIQLGEVHVAGSLGVLAKEGDITIKETVVKKEIELTAESGAIDAELAAERTVWTSSSGFTDLEIVSNSNILDVRTTSFGNRVNLVMVRPYNGHFTLSSSMTRPEVYSRCESCTFYTKSNNYTMEGYSTLSGWEPGYLPRLALRGRDTRLELRGGQ